jgi:S1-C subfamily serine protease
MNLPEIFDREIRDGVLISDDSQVLTAAHVVQSADAILVVFPDSKPVPTRVADSAVYADVALLWLTLSLGYTRRAALSVEVDHRVRRRS